MKTLLRSVFVLFIVASLASCTKVVVNQGSSLSGSWILYDAARATNYGWQTINTGLENGVFTFYDDGSVTYRDNQITMRGSWYIYNSTGDYFDDGGYPRYGAHQSLNVQLSGYNNSYITLNFENFLYGGNSFVGTDYYAGRAERYEFRRY